MIRPSLTNRNDALITACKMMLACIIAFITYHSLNLPEGYWAVVTIAAVTQVGFVNTLTKGFMRLLGTIIGAGIGYGFALLAQGNITIVLLLFFVFITLSSLIAIQPTLFSYSGVVTGLTIVIVLSSSLISGQLFTVAVYRSFEVIFGIIVLVLLNFGIALFFRKADAIWEDFASSLKKLPSELKKIRCNAPYFKSSLKIALACLATFALWVFVRQPEGFWATVSCLLIMEESISTTAVKASLRFSAHVIAALIGGICTLIIGPHFAWRLLPLAISFFGFGYLIGTKNKYASLGNTAGIALAVMLLFSPDVTTTFHVVIARFLNVLLGICIAIFVTHYLWPQKLKT